MNINFYKNALKQVKISLILLFMLTIITGLIYPVMITIIAQLFFPWQANGSMVEANNQVMGSLLIGQSFTEDKYFWSRPSATSPFPYHAASSSGSNMGPLNPDFLKTVKDRVTLLQKTDPVNNNLIPVDLVTASGSGLDPEISPLAALYQIPHIAKARQIPAKSIETLIFSLIQKRTLGILGEPRVNVLALNLALDKLESTHA